MATSLPRDIDRLLYISLEGGRYAGYKTEFMLERFDNEMCCVFCFGISQMPTRIRTCGHIACKSCLDSTVSLGLLKCPSDSRAFTTQQLQGDASMAKRIGEIEVNCPLQVRGCSWAGKLKQCYLHLQSCETRAPNPADYAKCRHCSEDILIGREEAEHNGICPAVRVMCPNKCQVDSIPRSHMPNHLQECPNSLIPCPLQTIGCEFSCSRYAMHSHMINELVRHMTLLVDSVDQKKMNNLDIPDANLGNLNERINRLEDTIATRDNEISLLKAQCKVLSDKIIEREHLGAGVYQMGSNNRTIQTSPECTYSPFCWIVHEVQKKRASNSEVISPGVYSTPGGYCFLFKLIASGLGMGRDTHLSLIAQLCEGSFDSNLVWPVKVIICFTTLNQVCDEQHIILEKKFTFNGPVTPPNTISLESLVIPDFLLYKRLATISSGVQYIREDTVSIQIAIHHLS